MVSFFVMSSVFEKAYSPWLGSLISSRRRAREQSVSEWAEGQHGISVLAAAGTQTINWQEEA